MKRAHVFSSALLILAVSVSAAAHAQGKSDKKPDPPQHGKAEQGDKHAQAQAPDKGRKDSRPAPASERRATVQTSKPAPVHVAKAAPARAAKPTPALAAKAVPVRSVRAMPAPAARPSAGTRPVPVSSTVQRQRADAEQRRAAQYRARLDQQIRLGQQQSIQLQRQQNRVAQYRAQQQYLAQLRAQQQRLQASRNYYNDPYIRTAPSYRYAYSGVTRQTNQYGADVLRQAVNYGYQEGVRFGQADRQDGLSPNVQASYAYRDANYGYAGNYVDQSDYNYYFRQGFQRGYTDGYYSRSQYGTSSNGSSSILANLLTTILGLTSLR
jgi:hypothetical protein